MAPNNRSAKVLIACEFSGIVRDAFIKRGFDAVSCDLLPTEQPGPHIQDTIFNHACDGWDLMIAHPPCTRLAVSGARWFKDKIEEQEHAILPKLKPTNIVDGRKPRVHFESPGKNRWKNRSRTYKGIADAMAKQWGAVLA